VHRNTPPDALQCQPLHAGGIPRVIHVRINMTRRGV
jgi:hypothetical protein